MHLVFLLLIVYRPEDFIGNKNSPCCCLIVTNLSAGDGVPCLKTESPDDSLSSLEQNQRTEQRMLSVQPALCMPLNNTFCLAWLGKFGMGRAGQALSPRLGRGDAVIRQCFGKTMASC